MTFTETKITTLSACSQFSGPFFKTGKIVIAYCPLVLFCRKLSNPNGSCE